MKNIISYLLILSLFFSCAKEDVTTIDNSPNEIVDESTLVLQEGFIERQINVNFKKILSEDKSILLVETIGEEEKLAKYNLPITEEWDVAKWSVDVDRVGNNHYTYENVILFRRTHHDFAVHLENGLPLYNEERTDCPESSLTGIDYTYFFQGEVIDEATQKTKGVIFVGDIREANPLEFLTSPPYDSIENNTSLGRIMNIDPFVNASGDEMLAIRYIDAQPDFPHSKNLFGVYNISLNTWTVENVAFDFHTLGTQTVIADNLIFYGSNLHVTCLDIETGALKWVTEANTLSPSRLLAFKEGDIFVKNYDGMTERRNGETGELVWASDLGELYRFIILNDKLFGVGRNFMIADIETGEVLDTFNSPYIDYQADNYFNSVSEFAGYYDAETELTHLFFNIDDNMIYYQMED